MPLTERQQHALEALDWLLDGSDENRQSGRSHVTAIALIRAACRRPRRWVRIVDLLAPERHMTRLLVEMIRRLVEDDYVLYHGRRLYPDFELGNDQFRFNLVLPIEDWVPVHVPPIPAGIVNREFRVSDSSMQVLPIRPAAPPVPIVEAPSQWEHILDETLF